MIYVNVWLAITLVLSLCFGIVLISNLVFGYKENQTDIVLKGLFGLMYLNSALAILCIVIKEYVI